LAKLAIVRNLLPQQVHITLMLARVDGASGAQT